jgi:hypothetical protein
MRKYSLFCFLVFLVFSKVTQGQSRINVCSMQIIRLKFDERFQPNGEQLSQRVLSLAKPTDSILVDNEDVMSFSLHTDTACCTYAGSMFITSHKYELTDEAATRLSKLQIPLCCGLPVALKIGGKEVYRGILWNPFSSFASKSVTITLVDKTMIVTNRLKLSGRI